MPVQPGTIICKKCGEDRPTLIHKVIDARGQQYVCMVCSNHKDFEEGSELSPKK